MKINTKKCTPVVKGSDIGKVAVNAYIPKEKDEEKEKEEEDYGREKTFIPEVIFTPTLSSKRTHPKPYPRLSENEVEDLTESISKMLISRNDDKKEPKSKKERTPRAKDPVVSSPPMGRFEVDVITESKAVVRVTRSLRLT